MQVCIHHMVTTLSRAVDLVGVVDVYHGRRVGMIAAELAKRIGFDPALQRRVFEAGLLHDCGVSTTTEHERIGSGFDVPQADRHAERGASLLADFRPLAHLCPLVRHHHTFWCELPAHALSPLEARLANLVHLADRIDALAGPYYRDQSLLMHTEAIRERIDAAREHQFWPVAVEAFMVASAAEAFWLLLDVAYLPAYVAQMEDVGDSLVANLDELRSFAELIAHIVDSKSHFTAEHSYGVARLTRFLGSLEGFYGDHLTKMEIAALLHDIGKLQIPDAVLEAPHALGPAERAIIKRHSFATYQILKVVGGFEELSQWAAQHHECPNGSGYPFRLSAEEISVEARIIKVADVYQALAQKRPYRDKMPPRPILYELQAMAERNEVDDRLVKTVAANLEDCHRAALLS